MIIANAKWNQLQLGMEKGILVYTSIFLSSCAILSSLSIRSWTVGAFEGVACAVGRPVGFMDGFKGNSARVNWTKSDALPNRKQFQKETV